MGETLSNVASVSGITVLRFVILGNELSVLLLHISVYGNAFSKS